jgi:hypothetical protein
MLRGDEGRGMAISVSESASGYSQRLSTATIACRRRQRLWESIRSLRMLAAVLAREYEGNFPRSEI